VPELRPENVEQRKQWNHVGVTLLALDRDAAVDAYFAADQTEPLGYQLRWVRISKRKKGGRSRKVTLWYVRRFDTPHPLVDTVEGWNEVTQHAQLAARGEEEQ